MIISTNLNRINIEKSAPAKGKIDVQTNVILKDVVRDKIKLGQEEQQTVKFVFEYNCNYEPKVAELTLGGDVVFLDTVEALDKLEKSWNKDRQIDKNTFAAILNVIYTKCNIEALVLTRDMQLPPPIALPKVTPK